MFLSEGWIVAVREIRDEFQSRFDPPAVDIAANITITDAPFDEPVVRGHIDTTGPVLMIDEGHIEHASFGVEMPYDIAQQVFVDRDPARVAQILFEGRVKLTGDSSQVLLLAGAAAPPGPTGDEVSLAREVLRRIDEITNREPG